MTNTTPQDRKTVALSLAIIIIAGLITFVLFARNNKNSENPPPVNNNGEQNGGTDTENGNQSEKKHLIRVTLPKPNTVVTSPLHIEGEARGYWFFEASFPIQLLDAHGNVLATAIAQAREEWMTTEFVPFTVDLTFTPPSGSAAKN